MDTNASMQGNREYHAYAAPSETASKLPILASFMP